MSTTNIINASSSSDVTQSLLDYASIISNYAANNTGAAKTIKAQVIKEIDAGNREYEISYGGSTFKRAYAIGEVKYDVSSIVYVLIPSGNLDQDKWILGSVSPVASNYVTEDRLDSYIDVSENLLGLVQQKREEFEELSNEIYLRTWENEIYSSYIQTKEGKEKIKKYLLVNNLGNFSSLFSEYLDNYRTFKLSVSIKTNIDVNHKGEGDYGLILRLPLVNVKTNEHIVRTYAMDTSNLEGDPFDFEVFQKNSIYFTIEDGFVYDTTKHLDPNTGFNLVAYTSGFSQYSDDELEILRASITPYDIVIKDFSMEIVDVLSEKDISGYHLSLVSNSGNYFLTGSSATDSKILTPILKVKGKTTNINDWNCYWFVQDYSVNTFHKNYLKIGGIGWKCLNRRTNYTSEKDFQYVTNQYQYEVKKSNVSSELKYKCVLTKVFKDEEQDNTIVVGGIISLKNLNSRVELYLKTITGSNNFIENIGNVGLIAQIRTDVKMFQSTTEEDNPSPIGYNISWQRFDKDNNYIPYEKLEGNDSVLDEEKPFYNVTRALSLVNETYEDVGGKMVPFYYYEMEISFPTYLINTMNTIYCTFYKIVNGGDPINLGTRSILITVGKETTYNVLIENGDILYKYDADGDSPMIANYDGPISSQLTETLPLSFKIFKPSGYELTEEEYKYVTYEWYLPLKSLMEFKGVSQDKIDETGRYFIVDNTTTINYDIATQYNKTKAKNNTIRLKVVFDGTEFWNTTNINFMKDGEGGTNGSKYAAIIKYKDMAYGQRGADGIPRKLHMVYVEDKGTWYVHDFDTNTLVDFAKNTPIFTLTVYRDGEPMDQKIVDKNWKMFDPENVLSKRCFTIIDEDVKDPKTGESTGVVNGRLSILDGESGKWGKNDNPCPIVQCELTISTEQATLGLSNQEYIFAYYPIEVSYLNEFPTEEYPMIPTLNGGFSEVLYDIDGNNPEWDNDNTPSEEVGTIPDSSLKKYNFEFIASTDKIKDNEVKIDGKDTAIYNYKWSVSGNGEENLKINEVKDQYASIKPSTKYAAGVSNNYIRVDYTWNSDTRAIIKEKIQNLKKEIDKIESKKAKYIGIYRSVYEGDVGDYKAEPYEEGSSYYKYIYTPGQGDYEIVVDKKGNASNGNRQNVRALGVNYFYENKIKKLKESLDSKFLEYVVSGLDSLDKALEVLDEWYEFCKGIEISKILIENGYDYETTYKYITQIMSNCYTPLYYLAQRYNNHIYTLKDLRGLYGTDNITGMATILTLDMTQEQYHIFDYWINTPIYTYSILFEEQMKRYNNAFDALVKGRTYENNIYYDDKCKYKTACENFGKVKDYLNTVIIDKAFQDLHGNFNFNANPAEEYTDLDKRTDFYDNGIQKISAENIDSFKFKIIDLAQFYERSNNDPNVFSYDYICNTYLFYIREAFEILYGDDVAEKEYYEGTDQVQDIFYACIKERNDKIQSYQTLLNDRSKNTTSIHIKPIIVFSNGAGLGYLNSWDGNRLYIDEDNGQYIMAPTIGAGIKEDVTSGATKKAFTGIVMGVKDFNKRDGYTKDDQQIGLHGFSKGKTSLFINARDGSAIFGKSGNGQITIDPSQNKALMYNSNYFSNDEKGSEGQGKPTDYKDIGKASHEWTENGTKHIYERHGMLIKFSAEDYDETEKKFKNPPFIHFADKNGKIYSGNHSEIEDDKSEGFYLSDDGLSIVGQRQIGTQETGFETVKSSIVLRANDKKNGGKIKIYSNGHDKLSSDKLGFYLGDDGFSITSRTYYDDKGRPYEPTDVHLGKFIIDMTNEKDANPKLYSNSHNKLNSPEEGFYLGNDGLSIGRCFKINSIGTPYIQFLNNVDGYICSGNHNKIDSKEVGFFLSKDGLSITGEYDKTDNTGEIIKDDDGNSIKVKSQFSIRTDNSPVIYTGQHTSLKDKNKGFYLSEDGMSIWNMFRVANKEDEYGVPIEKAGQLLVGNLSNTSGKYWTIGGVVPEYSHEWKKTRANGMFYKHDRNEGDELLKTHDTPLIPWLGYGATFITMTKDVKEGELYLAEEIYPLLLNDYNTWKINEERGIIPNPWNWPISPFKVPSLTPNCRVSDNEDGEKRESEKYKLVPDGSPSSWESYISYNADQIYIEEDLEKETDDLGVKYTPIKFKDEARKNQVYIGTNGFRLGKSFVVDNQGNAFLSGTIQAKDGGIIGSIDEETNEIKGWRISKEGIYQRVKNDIKGVTDLGNHAFSKKVIIGLNNDGQTLITKTWKFTKLFVILATGEIGFEYHYLDDSDSFKYWTRDDKTGELIDHTFKKFEYGDVVDSDWVKAWFGDEELGWHGFSDGSFNVHTPESTFGGVSIDKDGDKICTHFESEKTTSINRENGVFQLNCQDEIMDLAKEAIKNKFNNLVNAIGLDSEYKI